MKVNEELKNLMVAEPRLGLAVAESLTCGRVQARVGEVSGASEYFRGGVTAYTRGAKVTLLGVDDAAAKQVNSVSAEIAEQMARGACELFGAELGVATTGYAEAWAAGGVEVPFAWWAVVHVARRAPEGRGRGSRGGASEVVAVRTGRVECPGAKRGEVQAIVADAVLGELVVYLRAWRGK